MLAALKSTFIPLPSSDPGGAAANPAPASRHSVLLTRDEVQTLFRRDLDQQRDRLAQRTSA